MLYDPKKHLSSSEIGDAIEKLSAANLRRLKKIATLFAGKCGIPEDDLLQEAFTRALAGKRLCPSDVDVVRFLAWVMKSIASSNAKSFKSHPEVSLQTPKHENGREYQDDLKDNTPSMTEAAAIARMDLDKIQKTVSALFQSDSEPIQLLVMGILDGMDRGELQEFSGLRSKEYNSARRLFRRRIEKEFPGGWGND